MFKTQVNFHILDQPDIQYVSEKLVTVFYNSGIKVVVKAVLVEPRFWPWLRLF